jgi:hypothetical protein
VLTLPAELLNVTLLEAKYAPLATFDATIKVGGLQVVGEAVGDHVGVIVGVGEGVFAASSSNICPWQ